MSDPTAQKKGMRTFASDFARVKNANSSQTDKPSSTQTTPVSKPASQAVPKPPTPVTLTKHIPKTELKPVPKPEQTSSAPKKIPAFHEIEKSLKDIDLSDQKEKSKKRKKSVTKGITPSRRVGGGAIISDTKSNSFSLFSEIKKSLAGWFKTRKKKPAPQLAVPRADRRKGVIQQATTKTGTIFTADNETLKERIKERKRQEQSKPHDPETNWSPYTETGYPLLESAEEEVPRPKSATNNVSVEFKQRSVPEPQPMQPEPVVIPEPVEEPKTVEPEPQPAVAPEPEPEFVPAVESTPVTAPEPVVTPVTEPAEIIAGPEPTQQKKEPITTNELPLSTEEYKSQRISTNQLTLYISAGVALVLVTGFFAWVIYNNQQTQIPISITEPSVLSNDLTLETIVVSDEFSAQTLALHQSSSGPSELALVNAEQELLPSALIFTLVTPELPITIQQYATDVRFIQTSSVAPQMVIDIADPTSVIGAMLINEPQLITALRPLYGQDLQGSFSDQAINGVDVRVLSDNNQQTLTYGIINDQLLIVAETPEAFTEISSLINQQ